MKTIHVNSVHPGSGHQLTVELEAQDTVAFSWKGPDAEKWTPIGWLHAPWGLKPMLAGSTHAIDLFGTRPAEFMVLDGQVCFTFERPDGHMERLWFESEDLAHASEEAEARFESLAGADEADNEFEQSSKRRSAAS